MPGSDQQSDHVAVVVKRLTMIPLKSSKYKTAILAFSFGLASIVGQVALLREFMSLFSGHEIIIGIFLSFWMLFTGVGALIGGKTQKGVRTGLLPVVLSLTFVLGVLSLYLLRVSFTVHGAEPEFSTLVLIVFISLFPVCITTGYAFTKYSAEEYSTAGSWSISKVYVSEQAGSSVGGGLLYLILVQWLDSVKILVVVVFCLLLVAVFVSGLTLKKRQLLSVVVLMVGSMLLVIPLQKMLRGLEFKSEKIVSISDTPYGNMVVTKTEGQVNVYENGDLRSYSGEIKETEENVHAVMLRHSGTHKVLMLGGASVGTFKEFEKYNDVKVDYVDIDPAIVELLKKDTKSDDVNFFVTDPFRYLKNTSKKYDVIILNTGLPHNLQDNRFFTREFFEVAKKRVKSNGLLGVRGPEKQFHKEDNYLRYLGTIASTGVSVFKKFDVYPGNYIWFLFSDDMILPLFNEQYAYVAGKNLWFNRDYILPDLTEDERKSYVGEIKVNLSVNTCLKPVLLEQSITAKSGFWQINRYTYIYVISGIFIVVFMLFRRRSKTMAVAGFVLAGVQLLLIYMMQIVAGNLYEMIGVLFALSMAGMSLGGWSYKKYIYRLSIKYEILLLVMGMLILLFPFVLQALVSTGIWFVLQAITVYILVLLFAFFGGVLFSAVSYNKNFDTRQLAGSVYGADLIGSSAGVLLTSLFLIPVAGMVNAAFVLGMLCVMAALLLFKV